MLVPYGDLTIFKFFLNKSEDRIIPRVGDQHRGLPHPPKMTSLTRLKMQVENSRDRNWFHYRFGEDNWIITAKGFVNVYEERCNIGEPMDMILHYNVSSRKFHLYQSCPLKYIRAITQVYGIDIPFVKIEEKKVTELKGEDPLIDPVLPYQRTHKRYGWNWSSITCSVRDWTDHNGTHKEYFAENHLHILDRELYEFDPPDDDLWYYFPHKVSVNGEEVRIEQRCLGRDWVLTKEYDWGEDQVDRYPVKFPTLEPDPDACEAWWGNEKNRKNSLKVKISILMNQPDLPEDFEVKRCQWHFYSRQYDEEELLQIIDGCDCYRCEAWRIYKKKEGHSPVNISTLGYTGTILLWIGKHGYYPKITELLKTCTCTWCNKMRDTNKFKGVKKRALINHLRGIMSPERLKYYTWGGRAELTFDADKLPSNESELNLNAIWFRPSINLNWNIPPYLHDQVRMNLALIHARLLNMRYDEAIEESSRWLKEVQNSFLEPDCDCILCSELKTTKHISTSIFFELMIEPIDTRSYPTGIFLKHFRPYSVSKTKDDFIQYFKDYIMVGEFCQCNECSTWRNKIVNSKYLPPEELQRPTCPKCGNAVHNKDLIFDSAEISKKVIEQGFERFVGVKAALCCSCYGREKNKIKRLEKLSKAEKGTVVQYSDGGVWKKGVIKIHDDEKYINEIELGVFMTEFQDDFNILKYVEKKPED